MSGVAEEPTADDDVGRVLRRRAAALATPAEPADDGNSWTMLALALGSERYGVEAQHVEKVAPLPPVALLPGAPPPWLGLVNVRGSVRPLLSLRRYLGLGPDPPGPAGALVLLNARGLKVAALVDGIQGVERLPKVDLAAPVGGSGAHPVVRGVTGELLTVLDVDAMLADPGLVGEVSAGA
jgi:purine-binding chemotaxis protein CheW